MVANTQKPLLPKLKSENQKRGNTVFQEQPYEDLKEEDGVLQGSPLKEFKKKDNKFVDKLRGQVLEKSIKIDSHISRVKTGSNAKRNF